jgi:hypothetical protein
VRPWPLGSVPEPWRLETREDSGAFCVAPGADAVIKAENSSSRLPAADCVTGITDVIISPVWWELLSNHTPGQGRMEKGSTRERFWQGKTAVVCLGQARTVWSIIN